MGKEDLDETLLGIIQDLGAGDIVYEIDSDGNFTFINDAVKQLGYEPKELIGKHFSILVHPSNRRDVSRSEVLPIYKGKKTGDQHAPKLFDERRTEERTTKDLEIKLLSKDKEVVIGNVTSSGHYVPSVKSENKRFVGTVGVIRNVAEKSRVHDYLRLGTRSASMRIFAGGIAHDLYNLIMGTRGNLDLLVTKGQVDKDNPNYNSAISALGALEGLANNLRYLSEGTTSKKTDIDVYDIARKVFGWLNKADYLRINKVIGFSKGEFYIHTNEYDFVEIVLNLAKNSLESIIEKGIENKDYLRISAERYIVEGEDKTGLPKGEYVHILFEDTGKGMSEEDKKKIFDPWFTTKKDGQGIGLTTVHNIITENNKGYIEVESAEGKGTKFHIYLPKGIDN